MPTYAGAVDVDRSAWRLLPSEEVLWKGAPASVPRDRLWVLLPIFFFAFALVAALFAMLLRVAELEGVRNTVATAALLGACGVATVLAPRYLFDGCAYLVTDRRILWRRGRFVITKSERHSFRVRRRVRESRLSRP